MIPSVDFVLCICTYRRTALLELLLGDVFKQTVQPKTLIVVDGDPACGEVRAMLQNGSSVWGWKVLYLPSNHANLAYQRYLGWRAAQQGGANWLLYLDDDLRLSSSKALESLFLPVQSLGCSVNGVTALAMGGNQVDAPRQDPYLVRLFGSTSRIEEGGLTPTGGRIWPIPDDPAVRFKRVHWLQGRAMLIAMSALCEESFSRDLFASYELRIGRGEDTILSRRISSEGEFWCVLNHGFEHPDADLPNAYPTEAYSYAYAFAYSRRLLNDHYRYPYPPTFGDRWALLTAYLGNGLLASWRAIRSPRADHWAYTSGYLAGALRGLFQKPSASVLTPSIDWGADAEIALSGRELISKGIFASI